MAYSKSSKLTQGVFFALISYGSAYILGKEVRGRANGNLCAQVITTSHELPCHLIPQQLY